MIFNLIFTILASVIGFFELAIFFCGGKFVKKPVEVFIIGAVVCAALTVALAVVGIIHTLNF